MRCGGDAFHQIGLTCTESHLCACVALIQLLHIHEASVRQQGLEALLKGVTSQVRGRVWPLLLGVEPHLSPEAEEEYLEARCAKHADSSVVECDIQRSLWSFTEGMSRRKHSKPLYVSFMKGLGSPHAFLCCATPTAPCTVCLRCACPCLLLSGCAALCS